MSGEGNPVSKSFDDAINCAKSDIEDKTNIKSVATVAEDTVLMVSKDNGSAQTANSMDPGLSDPQNQGLDNLMVITGDHNTAAEANINPTPIIKKEVATVIGQDTVQLDEVN